MASEPVSRPMMAFAAVKPADAAIDPSATFSFSFIPRFALLFAGQNGSILPVRQFCYERRAQMDVERCK
jgi:hypothetical protein